MPKKVLIKDTDYFYVKAFSDQHGVTMGFTLAQAVALLRTNGLTLAPVSVPGNAQDVPSNAPKSPPTAHKPVVISRPDPSEEFIDAAIEAGAFDEE